MASISRRPYTVSHADEPAEDLRARFQRDGYLYLKRAVKPDLCQALLADIL